MSIISLARNGARLSFHSILSRVIRARFSAPPRNLLRRGWSLNGRCFRSGWWRPNSAPVDGNNHSNSHKRLLRGWGGTLDPAPRLAGIS
jgi:hypothetical protein